MTFDEHLEIAVLLQRGSNLLEHRSGFRLYFRLPRRKQYPLRRPSAFGSQCVVQHVSLALRYPDPRDVHFHVGGFAAADDYPDQRVAFEAQLGNVVHPSLIDIQLEVSGIHQYTDVRHLA